MFCPNCGKKVDDGRFCPECGTELTPPIQVAAQPQEPVPPVQQEQNVQIPVQQEQNVQIPVQPAQDFQIPVPAPQQEQKPPKVKKEKKPKKEKPPKPEKAPKEKADKPKKGKKKWTLVLIITAVVLVLAVVAACLWFFVLNKDEPKKEKPQRTYLTILDITAEQRDIVTGRATDVKVTAQTNGETAYESLSLLDGDGNALATLRDDGVGADSYAGDHVYSASVEFRSEEPKTMTLTVTDGTLYSDKSETIYFYPEYDYESYRDYENVRERISDTLYRYDDLEEGHAAVMEMLGEMLEEGEIADYSFEAGSISVKLPLGGTYVYSYNPGGEWKSGESGEVAPEPSATMYSITPNIHKVTTLQPYRHDLGPGGVDTAGETIADSEYNFVFSSNLDNDSVSVEQMKQLDQFNVILLDGHGSYNRWNHSSFGTGTGVNSTLDEQYWADLYFERLIKLDNRYYVTSAFFDRYYDEGDFGECIVYLGCCHGADDWVLADTLVSKGVDVVFAYRNPVTVGYDMNMVQTIFRELSKESETPVTVAQALETAQAEHGKTDDTFAHWYNWLFGNYEEEANRALLKVYGNTEFTLDMASNSMRGKVAQSSDGKPLASAVVTAYDSASNTAMASTRTDSNGNFDISLEAGNYRIVVRSSGFMSCTVSDVAVEHNCTTYLENTILLEQAQGNPLAVVAGVVTNAVTGDSEPGVTIRFRSNYNNVSGDYVKWGEDIIEVTTNDQGEYIAENLIYGYYTAEISKEGFVTKNVNVVAAFNDGSAEDQNMVIAPEASGSDFRITLEWGENPRDEDSHLICESPDNYHVYFWDKNAYRGDELVCNLDHDDTRGNGFETVTLTVDPTGKYRYYVYHYAGSESLSTSNAIVTVYQGGVMVKRYNVPIDQGTGRYWHVFNIVNGQIVTVNRINNESTP